MKNIIIALTAICCVCALAAYAQDAAAPGQANAAAGTTLDTSGNDVQPGDSVSDTGAESDISADTVQSKNDSLNAGKSDSFDDFDSDDDLEVAAALSDTAASAQKLGNIKRGYERKRQVTLAIAMMVLIILALGTSQSFNPR